MTVDELYRQGCQHYSAGRHAEAEALFRQCLSRCPAQPDILNALGSCLAAQGRLAEATQPLEQACRLKPDSAPFRFNLANLLRSRDDRQGAYREYREALRCDPGLAAALHGLGSLHLEDGDLDLAETFLTRAVACDPGISPAWHDLGQLRQRQGALDEAEACYRRSIDSDGSFVPAFNALGMMLLRRNRVEEARTLFEQAIAIDPAYLQARCNLAVLATWCGELEFAIRELRDAAADAPEDGDIHFNLSLALLAAGEMAEGWREHEWRFRKAAPVPVRHRNIPRWQGEPLAGRTILVHAEQGYGDSLQFIRYASTLAAQGGTVLVEGQDRIITPLLATVPGVAAAFPRDESMPCRPDCQVPIMSLGLALGERHWPPPQPPYLNPDSERVAFWREALSGLTGLKVGIAWAGRPEHENDANRSLPPELLAPLAEVAGVSWVSLQFGAYRPAPPPLVLHDLVDKATDFCDSAALVAGLDLVIAVDSAVAHLAGGLGVPAWVLLPWNSDWRWLRNRNDSPWYPAMHLYRQPGPGAWDPVLREVAHDLAMLSADDGEKAGHPAPDGRAEARAKTKGGNTGMRRDLSPLNDFLDRIEADVYPEAPSFTHTEITGVALQRLMELFPLRPGMKVLDVGCGQGPALEFFREHQTDYLGVTLSDEDVAACRAKGFRVEKMDQSFLDVPAKSQDLVWARHVIEHSIFPFFTLHGFNRVLRHGGMLYLEVPAPETSCHHERNPNHYSVLSKGSWRSLIERSGFLIRGDADYTFEVPAGPDRYWGFYCVKQATP